VKPVMFPPGRAVHEYDRYRSGLLLEFSGQLGCATQDDVAVRLV
jgi:hypothetical protein